MGRSAVDLPKPDETGRIKYVASVPTGIFAPGRYELRAAAMQGARAATSHTVFLLIP